jgi:DNA-directed RNA polymerase specialized sigma24 family protein
VNAVSDLDRYNEQVLAHQNEAFTLAAYLSRDDREADRTVEQAFLSVFRQWTSSPGESIRLPVLREVVRLSSPSQRNRNGRSDLLQRVSPRERRALLLVDVLGLSYDEAASVLGCSRSRLARLLAQARGKGMQSRTTRKRTVAAPDLS